MAVTGIGDVDPRAQGIKATLLKAYRWQYIVSGAIEPRFQKALGELVSPAQLQRIEAALAPLTYAMPAPPSGAASAGPAVH